MMIGCVRQGTAIAVVEADGASLGEHCKANDQVSGSHSPLSSPRKKMPAQDKRSPKRRRSARKPPKFCRGHLQRLITEGSAKGVPPTEALNKHLARPENMPEETQP